MQRIVCIAFHMVIGPTGGSVMNGVLDGEAS